MASTPGGSPQAKEAASSSSQPVGSSSQDSSKSTLTTRSTLTSRSSSQSFFSRTRTSSSQQSTAIGSPLPDDSVPMDMSQPADTDQQPADTDQQPMEEEPSSPPRHWVPRHRAFRHTPEEEEALQQSSSPIFPEVQESLGARSAPRSRTCALPGCQPHQTRRHRIPAAFRDEWIQGCILAMKLCTI